MLKYNQKKSFNISFISSENRSKSIERTYFNPDLKYDSYIDFIYQNITRYFPSSFLENYKEYIVESQSFSSLNKTISMYSHFNDDFFKINE